MVSLWDLSGMQHEPWGALHNVCRDSTTRNRLQSKPILLVELLMLVEEKKESSMEDEDDAKVKGKMPRCWFARWRWLSEESSVKMTSWLGSASPVWGVCVKLANMKHRECRIEDFLLQCNHGTQTFKPWHGHDDGCGTFSSISLK